MRRDTTLETSPSTLTTIRVLTLNIFGEQDGWEDRRAVLVDGLRALQPDLIALQETVVHGDHDQVRTFLDAGFNVVHSRVRHADGMGISIASRWPIVAVDEPELPRTSRTGDFPCTSLVADIAVPTPFGLVRFVNHFPNYHPAHEWEREAQTVAVARFIEGQAGDDGPHVVLAGDLDAEPDAASLRFLTGRQSLDGLSVCYRNAWEAMHPDKQARTFTAENALMDAHTEAWPVAWIDHIFVRCGKDGWPTLQPERCELAFAEPVDGVWASGHIGVVADLSVAMPGLR